jgi:hypothetical protein
MTLLKTARQVKQYMRNPGKLVELIWAEFTNLDTRVSALDGSGETELSMLEASDNAADIIVANASKVADWVPLSGDATIASTGALTIGAAKVDASKLAVFQSTEQTGDGNPQNVAHGLGASPTIVFVELTSVGTDGATVSYTKGSTNVVVTATSGAKYVVHAIK